MGFLDEIKKLTQPFDDEEDEFFDDDEAQTRIPVSDKAPSEAPKEKRGPFAASAPQEKKSTFFSDESQYDAPKPAFGSRREVKRDGNVVSINGGGQLKLVLVKPERFEEAAEIGDHLRERRTVVMNLEQTSKDTARRLIDFLSGVAYAQDGKIRRVANNTYLITPNNVDLMGDLLDGMENSGMSF